ncbi:Wzz/FepE/Etk N-terminal domain-containing protein [Cytobacillus sp.]|uniref:YveK family protein n=1 Tax=Cytobacillus sp. TaxID=2675269 RepID=UPI0028BDF259|nr:Wzz/FepE/Etk N-terminal domain-containing protein [Cytobacillus sp.]
MEDTFSIKEKISIIKKRWWLIALFTISTTALSIVATLYILSPKYEASTQILVNQKNLSSQLDVSQLRNNIELINTYSVIIKSPIILEKVIKKLELKQNVDQLNTNIFVNSQSDSQVFLLTVQDSDPDQAVKIANTISETFQQDIKGIMNIDNVNILAKAELKDHPVPISPKPIMNIAVGIVAGLLIGVGVSFLIEYFDNSIKRSEDIEAFLDLVVLGMIHKIPKQRVKKSYLKQKMEVDRFESKVENGG